MKAFDLIAGTADGIRRIRINSDQTAHIVARAVCENAIRGIAIRPDDPESILVAAGLRGWGLHRSGDGGRTFEPAGFSDRWVWDVAFDRGEPSRILIGTEPPMLYESTDGGETWRDFSMIDDVKSRSRWTFFHPPFHAGHLHGIAITPERPARIVVGVEHGGLLLSTDRGHTWRDVMPGADLHRVEIDPSNPDRIYAGAGNGLFLSEDGGESWATVPALRGRYIHGIIIDPTDTGRIIVYSDSPHCPLYQTLDGGATWEAIGAGLPASKPADPIRFHPSDPAVLVFAGDGNLGSDLYLSVDGGAKWTWLDVELPKVWRLETIPD